MHTASPRLSAPPRHRRTNNPYLQHSLPLAREMAAPAEILTPTFPAPSAPSWVSSILRSQSCMKRLVDGCY